MKKTLTILLILALSSCASLSDFRTVDSHTRGNTQHGAIIRIETSSSFWNRTTTLLYADGYYLTLTLKRGDLTEGWKITEQGGF